MVSDEEKAPVRRQVGIRKTIAVDASLLNQVASEPGVTFWPGMSVVGGQQRCVLKAHSGARNQRLGRLCAVAASSQEADRAAEL